MSKSMGGSVGNEFNNMSEIELIRYIFDVLKSLENSGDSEVAMEAKKLQIAITHLIKRLTSEGRH